MTVRVDVAVRGQVAWLLAAALLLATWPSAAANETPKAFLDGIYVQYIGKASKGISLDSEATIRRYFAPQLADAIVKDHANSKTRNEPPMLNGDPFIDAQDWDITNLMIRVKASGDKAMASVRFRNLKRQITIALDLVKLAEGWRIHLVIGPDL